MSSCKFCRLRKFQPAATALPSSTPTKQNTKNYENVHMIMRKITKKTKLKFRKLCKLQIKLKAGETKIQQNLEWFLSLC